MNGIRHAYIPWNITMSYNYLVTQFGEFQYDFFWLDFLRQPDGQAIKHIRYECDYVVSCLEIMNRIGKGYQWENEWGF